MRTITFEVEVDDKIFDTMVPSIYDEAVKEAPDGRLFLCVSMTSVVKKLVRVHRDVTAEGGTESPWFENIFLPDDMRNVGMSDPHAAEYVNGKLKMVDELEKGHPHFADAAPDAIPSSTLHEDHRVIIEDLCDIKELIGLIKQRQANSMDNQNANRDLMLARTEEIMQNFKQVHEYHEGESKYFAEAENRMTRSIEAVACIAANTANTVGHDILHALPELEDRIKECVGHPVQSAVSNDVTPQALLKAIEIVSGVMLRGAK